MFIHADPFGIIQILFEVPSNLMLKKIGPSKWISIVMLSWGMVSDESVNVISSMPETRIGFYMLTCAFVR